MIKLKYIGEETIYDILFKKISKNIVQITGDFPVQEKGFICFRAEDKEDTWNYEGFATVYREIDGGAQFSNDGSVYVEPVTPEDPEPYVPTEEELAAIFEQNKRDKINLSKSLLESFLLENPLISTAHGGTEGTYSVTNEKQTLMMSQYMTYQIEKTVNENAKLTWNETGKSCEEWTEQEFMQLIMEIKSYVYPLVSYQQTLEEQIAACTNQETLDKIVIDYATVQEG